jgi:hypothetical protein
LTKIGILGLKINHLATLIWRIEKIPGMHSVLHCHDIGFKKRKKSFFLFTAITTLELKLKLTYSLATNRFYLIPGANPAPFKFTSTAPAL